jgi:modulator of FtsH protease
MDNNKVLDSLVPLSDATQTHKVLRQTYFLLALTLAFSGLVAYVSNRLSFAQPNFIVTLIGFYGLMYLINKFRNSGLCLILTFVGAMPR